MVVNKADIFNEQDKILADLAKTMAHPARIKILIDKNVSMCGYIMEGCRWSGQPFHSI